jgi:hypothetical protein
VIPIQKGTAPLGLVRAGQKHAKELCEAYDADPLLYGSARRKMAIRRSIYASKSVKARLEACHHGKCCYCETLIPKPYAYSCVEHWRPKSSWRQGRGQKSTWPGYYWLAYSWDNLLLCCVFCNSDNNKNDLFPLKDPAARARHHGMRVEDEEPAILKPDGDKDPRDHITFRGAEPVGLTPLGRKTIKVLGLDSPKHGLRRDYLEDIKKRRELSIHLMRSPDPIYRNYAEHARKFVEEAVLPDKPYSAMVAAFLEANPLPDPTA